VKNRKTKTTVEIHEVYVIRQAEISAPVLCAECATGAPSMVTPEEAAVVAGIAVRRVYRLVEAGSVHYFEAEDGSLLVCLNSMTMTRS
jgi:hypothetical protein